MTGHTLRRSWPTARVAVAVLMAMALALGACGSDDDSASPSTTDAPVAPEAAADDEPSSPDTDTGDPDSDTDGDPDTGSTNGADMDAFCEVAAETTVVVAREFVGSDAHVEVFDRLIAVAPDEAVDDLQTMRDHFENDVDPAVPSSQDFENFAPDIQAAATRAQDYIAANC